MNAGSSLIRELPAFIFWVSTFIRARFHWTMRTLTIVNAVPVVVVTHANIADVPAAVALVERLCKLGVSSGQVYATKEGSMLVGRVKRAKDFTVRVTRVEWKQGATGQGFLPV